MPVFIRALIYMCVGVTGEIIFTSLKSLITKKDLRLQGYTQLWVMPMYAVFSVLVFEPLHNGIRDIHILFRFAIYGFLVFVLEYIFCVIYRFLVGICPWEYKGKWSVHGCINLPHFPVWGLLGLLAEQVHNYLGTLS